MTADAPDRVEAPVKYGPSATAIVVYVCEAVPVQGPHRALAELFGSPVSPGTVAAMAARAAATLSTLGGFCEQVRDELADAQP